MTRILSCTAFVTLALSVAASAQDGLRSASLPERPLTNPVPAPRPELYNARPGTYAPRYDRLMKPLRGYPGGYAGWGPYPEGIVDPSSAAVAAYGYLQLQMQPVTALVYVDGLYVGSVDDLRSGRRFEAGPHRLEVRAPGYQSLSIDVRIDPGETTIYRTDLTTVAVAPVAAPAVAAAPKTFYVIPGCYAGDRRPDVERLPQGCLSSNMISIPPVLSRVTSRR